MSDWARHVERIADIFFNGRPAVPRDSEVTVPELVARKDSTIIFRGKLYRVSVEEMRLERKGRQ